MFFRDPVAAFVNIGRSLRGGGRLAVAVWGPLPDNPWMFVPTVAAAPVLGTELTIPGPDEPGPFSLAEVEHVDEVLTKSGFADIAIEKLSGSRLITAGAAGDDAASLLEVGPLGEAYAAADDPTRRLAVESVLDAIEAYREGEGWRLPGSALKVIARRP